MNSDFLDKLKTEFKADPEGFMRLLRSIDIGIFDRAILSRVNELAETINYEENTIRIKKDELTEMCDNVDRLRDTRTRLMKELPDNEKTDGANLIELDSVRRRRENPLTNADVKP